MLALTMPAVQAESQLAMAAVTAARHNRVAHQGPFVPGLVPVTRQQQGLALLASGRVHDTRFRLRAAVEATHPDNAQRSTASSVRLMELARSFEWGENGLLTVGKTAINWDVGHALQPVGFFERRPDLVDGQDFEGRTEGLPLLAMAWITTTRSLTLAYAADKDRTTHQLLERWGLHASWTDPGLSTALVLHKGAGQAPGLGGTLAWTISERSVLHASAYARGKWRAVAGLTHATDAHNSWIAEVSHDAQALAASDWDRWRTAMQAHRQQHMLQPGGAGTAMLLDDIGRLGTLSAGRSMLYLQWRHQQDDWSLMPQLLARSDGSLLLNVTASWRWRGNLQGEASWTQFNGRATSYHAQLPWRSSVRISLKADF